MFILWDQKPQPATEVWEVNDTGALGKAHYRDPGRLFDVGDLRQMMWEGESKVTMEKPPMKCKKCAVNTELPFIGK